MPRAPRVRLIGFALLLLIGTAPASAGDTVTFSPAWQRYVVPRASIVAAAGVFAAGGAVSNPTGALGRGAPAVLGDREAYVDVDFGREVAGSLEVRFARASKPPPIVSVAFSESLEYLKFQSDYSRHQGTDDHVPRPGGETWLDRSGCQRRDVCSDGIRGFRYVRIYLRTAGTAAISGVRVRLSAPLASRAYRGWFLSSDAVLNRSWYASAYTVDLVTDRLSRDNADPRGCAAPGFDGRLMILDGAKHDRCPWAGDLAVSGLTELLTHGEPAPVRNVLAALGRRQTADGYVPASLLEGDAVRLVDYPAWWVLSLRDYAFYTGDLGFARREWPVLRRLLDGWYAEHLGPDGLLNFHSVLDYAFLPHSGQLVTYFNANYVRAARAAAELAAALGHGDRAAAWRARAGLVAAAVARRFWDSAAGAYLDSNAGLPVHPQDGNALAVLAGIGGRARGLSALSYLARTTRRPWGNALADSSAWSDGRGEVYPFMTYFDVLARFSLDRDDDALDELRRTWGWMLDPAHMGPGTVWEAIGRGGRFDSFFEADSSLAHGWSSGAAPALTGELLGVVPTAVGFRRFDAVPHPGGVRWAQGQVPTPRGPIRFGWRRQGSVFLARLVAPRGTLARVGVPTFGRTVRVWVDGKLAARGGGRRVYVTIPGGRDVSIRSS